MARRIPHPNGRKPPPPIRTGPTRSVFDGCAVVAVLVLAGMVSAVGLGVGAWVALV